MDSTPLSLLFTLLAVFVLLSACFSAAETGIMTVNRYRLKHLAKAGHRGAQRVLQLLNQPDRLLGTILVGNNVMNIAASQVATLIGLQLFGDLGVAIAGGVITLAILIFGEVGPKTFAAAYPERVAFISSVFIAGLLKLLFPVVWLVNGLANALFRINQLARHKKDDKLNPEELRTLVGEVFLPLQHRKMLIGVLELDDITVNDIMVPRQDVVGINLEDDIDAIEEQLRGIQHTRIPLYKGELNNTAGILHVRNATRFLGREGLTKSEILQYAREPYYVPEGTSLHTQLLAFQKLKRRFALVVDEYGDVQGIVTLEDILEEVVGEFTTNVAENHDDITPQADGSYMIEGAATIRDINRALQWQLPNSGPRTLNGLILEHLETIPEFPLCLRIQGFCIEILQTKDNTVKMARILPPSP